MRVSRHFEGEVVAVIGKQCRRVAPDQAGRYILGYTCGNDVSERTWQKEDRTLWRAKGSDTFSPVGPWIETDVDPQQLELLVKLNGQEMSRSKTSSMIFPFSGIVSYISQHATLYPGDLVFSGGSGVSRPMKPGELGGSGSTGYWHPFQPGDRRSSIPRANEGTWRRYSRSRFKNPFSPR